MAANTDDESMDTTNDVSEEIVDIVHLEITHCNGEKFWGLLPDSVMRKIWTHTFRRPMKEIETHNFKQIKNHCLKINFELKVPTKLSEICPTPEFNFSYETLGKRQLMFGKIRDYSTLVRTPKIGDTVVVTVLRTVSEVKADQIKSWLEHFGTLIDKHYYDQDSEGNKTGNFHVKLQLKHYIPEFLPIFGLKARIYFPGMIKQCTKCYRIGHLQRACTKEKIQWIDFVERLLDTGIYPKSIFGSWIEVIDDKNGKRPEKRSKDSRKRSRSRSPKPTRRYIAPRQKRDRREEEGRQTYKRNRSPDHQTQNKRAANRRHTPERGYNKSGKRDRSPYRPERRFSRSVSRDRSPDHRRYKRAREYTRDRSPSYSRDTRARASTRDRSPYYSKDRRTKDNKRDRSPSQDQDRHRHYNHRGQNRDKRDRSPSQRRRKYSDEQTPKLISYLNRDDSYNLVETPLTKGKPDTQSSRRRHSDSEYVTPASSRRVVIITDKPSAKSRLGNRDIDRESFQLTPSVTKSNKRTREDELNGFLEGPNSEGNPNKKTDRGY